MKRYVTKILLFFLPIILLLIPAEIILRKNTFQAKRDYIAQNKEEIEVLLLGPSFIWRGINPEYLEFNTAPLAHVGTGINTNKLVFDKFVPQFPKLKYVVFDLSMSYLDRANSKSWEFYHLFHIYYDIRNQDLPYKNNFLITSNFPIYIKKFLRTIGLWGQPEKFNKFGFIEEIPDEDNFYKLKGYDPEKIKNSDYLQGKLSNFNETNNSNYDNNVQIVQEMVDRCLDRNIEVIFLSPPKHYLFNELIGQVHFAKRERFLNRYSNNPKVHFWNYEKSYEYQTHLFLDDSHLNVQGAKIFTHEINQRLKELSRKENQAYNKKGDTSFFNRHGNN